MKIEIDDELVYQLKDSMMINFLKEDLEILLETQKHYNHPDDITYDKKLIKAYKQILDYYGVKDD